MLRAGSSPSSVPTQITLTFRGGRNLLIEGKDAANQYPDVVQSSKGTVPWPDEPALDEISATGV